jgi:hypothetical protein
VLDVVSTLYRVEAVKESYLLQAVSSPGRKETKINTCFGSVYPGQVTGEMQQLCQ